MKSLRTLENLVKNNKFRSAFKIVAVEQRDGASDKWYMFAKMTNTPAPLKSSAPRSSFRDMLYIRPQLCSYVTCNRIVAIFVRATPYTGERRSFDQLETSNTILLLNASADMPRQAHTCVDRAVVSITRTLFLLYSGFIKIFSNINYIFITFVLC